MEKIGTQLLAECYDRLALSIALSKQQATVEDLAPLLQFCSLHAPPPTSPRSPQSLPISEEETGGGGWPAFPPLPMKPPAPSLNTREQLAVLALAKFMRASKGRCQSDLVPLLLQYLTHIPDFTWDIPRQSSVFEQPAASFSYSLVRRLLDVAALPGEAQQEPILTAIFQYISQLTGKLQASEKAPVHAIQAILPSLDGVLRALFVPPFWRRASTTEALIRCILPLLNSSTSRAIQAAILGCKAASPVASLLLHDSFHYDNHITSGALRILRNAMSHLDGSTIARRLDTQWKKDMLEIQPYRLEKDHVLTPAVHTVLEENIRLFLDSLDQLREFPGTVEDVVQARILAYHHEIVELCMQNIIFCSLAFDTTNNDLVLLMGDILLGRDCLHMDSSLLLSLVHFLGLYGLKFSSEREECQETLYTFLLSRPETMASLEDATKLSIAHIASRYLVEIMSLDKERKLPLAELTSSLCSAEDPDNLACLTTLFGRVSMYAEDADSIADVILPILIRQLHEHQKSNLTVAATLNQIVELTFVDGLESLTEVAETLSSFSCSASVMSRAEATFTLRTVTAKQMEIAKNIKNHATLLVPYLSNILRLFTDKTSMLMASKLNADESHLAQLELVWLLYIIYEVASHASSSHIWSAELLHSFRIVWTTSVRFGMTAENVWKEHWRGGALALAKSSPYLLGNGIATIIDTELETAALENGPQGKEELKRLRSLLGNLLPECNKDDLKFSSAQCLFLLAIYHSEQFDELRYARVFQYYACMQDSPMAHVLEQLTTKLFKKTVEKYRQDQHSKEAVRTLAVNVLLEYPTSTQENVQRLALRHVKMLFDTFPYLLWDAQTIAVALEILQLAYTAGVDGFLGKNVYTYRFKCGSIQRNYDVCRGQHFRETLIANMLGFVEEWLSTGIQRCPSEMNAALQNFLGRFDEITNEFVHVGITVSARIAVTHGLYQVPSLPLTGFSHAGLANNSTRLISLLGRQLHNRGGFSYLKNTNQFFSGQAGATAATIEATKQELQALASLSIRKDIVQDSQASDLFFRTAAAIRSMETVDFELLHLLCWVPIQIFSAISLQAGIDAWVWLISSRPDLELRIMNELADVWEWTIRRGRGIFSQKYNVQNAFMKKMSTGPSKAGKEHEVAFNYFLPHLMWIDFFISHFDLVATTSEDHMAVYFRVVQSSMYKKGQNSNHPLARLCYMKLWILAWKILELSHFPDWYRELTLKERAYDFLVGFFALPVTWNGYDQKYTSADARALFEIYQTIKADNKRSELVPSKSQLRKITKEKASQQPHSVKTADMDVDSLNEHVLYSKKAEFIQQMRGVAIILLELELRRLKVWFDPVGNSPNSTVKDIAVDPPKRLDDNYWRMFSKYVWSASPRLALQLANRLANPVVTKELKKLVVQDPTACILHPEAAMFLATEENVRKNIPQLKYLPFWAPISPIQAISFFVPPFGENPHVLQFSLRSLDSYAVEHVFFYVPQIVQALRYDSMGYVSQFVADTAALSQLFAHQIIWNMKANMYMDGDSQQPDPIKFSLDRMTETILGSLSGDDQDFYEREFTFFERVTGISGKLKPFIRRTKQEKKEKIDEELRQIAVVPGVYLPSNPESIVVDIVYNSGRPLQSHAKAPFMATFKIKKAPMESEPTASYRQSSYESLFQDDQNDSVSEEMDEEEYTLQSAIFKVGDDCRQDVLALQLISVFKNIFANAGLELYLFPYRIVATAPGCGVIEVVPNSVSRDQMGRGSINDLHKWFLMKFGGENSVGYQKAQDAFVESLAAYSIVLYLLQIKDRHNGNMMIDEEGHVIHIDFGFIFDIVPGGVKFELSPFKLTKEMIKILGGSPSAPNYRRFVELCVRAFLVCRPHADQIVNMVRLMLDSGLPCFKREVTLVKLRQRFVPDMSEQAAADFMIGLVRSAHGAFSTTVYDGYQKLTNGIPY